MSVHLLRPAAGAALAPGTRINGIGWIVSDTRVSALDVYIRPSAHADFAVHTNAPDTLAHAVQTRDDGAAEIRLAPARLGLSPTDLAMLIGQTPSEATTGFVFGAMVPVLPPGPVTLVLRVRTETGQSDHAIALTIAPLALLSGPRGGDKRPAETMAGEAMRAVVEVARIDERGILHVTGWAVARAAIERLDVFVLGLGGGARLAGAAQGRMPRDDVAAALPDYPNAALAGFLLRREADASDFDCETVRLVVVAGGGSCEVVTPLARPAHLRRRPLEVHAALACEELSLADDGVLAVKGWAVAASGVAAIVVELDDQVVGEAVPAETRPDVANRYPRIAGAELAGFRYERRLDGGFQGDHVVRLTVRGQTGEDASCFQPVTVHAAPPRPRDTIASPAPSGKAGEDGAIKFYLDAPACRDGFAIETVRGFLSINGWAFGRDGIDRIEVFVDGVSQGRAHHGIRREDLQASFPTHDALRAGFAMVLPPQVMRRGEHAVRIDICDRAGRAKEIGFSVRAEPAASGPGPWMVRAKIPRAEIDLHHAVLAACGAAPRWTVLGVLEDAGPATIAALTVTADSLRWQAYDDWSLTLLAPDATAVVAVAAALAVSHPDLSPRIHVIVAGDRADDEIASPDGIKQDFVVFVAPGDRLGEDALLEYAVEAALAPDADFLYADERRRDPSDGEEKAFFKPDWSPDLLLSTNYVGHGWAVSAALLRRAGLGDATPDIPADAPLDILIEALGADLRAHGPYDVVLRLTEHALRILHVPKVLCARAVRAPRTAMARAGGRALAHAMRRRSIHGTLLAGPVPGTWRIRRTIHADALAATVSIIIPTNAAGGFVRTAIESIRANTAWPSVEIVVLDNISPDAPPDRLETKAWIAAHADRVIDLGRETFNWSRFNNRGARAARGAFLLFLNDDVEVRAPDWLHGLVEHAQRPEVGVVGPQLLYPDGRVQHAGVFLARRAARHAFRFYPKDEPGPFGLALTTRDVVSVTGAAMMMRRAVFDALGGFDAAHAVVNNDLDFSLRARAAGLAVVYTPAVSLVHHEMVSRAALPDTFDAGKFARQWGDLFARGDPFFNRHLSYDVDDYAPDAEPVRVFAAGHPLVARESVRKILVVKVDHIGDFVTAFPAFRRIKRHFPDAHLTVLAARASLALAAMEPAIDRVEEFNFYHARSERGRRVVGRRELDALRVRLAPERFDLAIDLRRQADTRVILQATGARWLAGFDRGYAYPWLDIAVEFEGDLALHHKSAHVTESLVGMVDAVSARCDIDRAVIAAPPARVSARGRLVARLAEDADTAVLAARLADAQDTRVVCVHTGAGAVNKQWPAASFAALIDLLAGTGAVVVVIGGPDERAFAAGVLRMVRRRAAIASLVGRTSLRALPDILAGCDLYVGNDSGPKHIAASLGVPTIGIHGGSVDAGEWGAMGPRALTIRRDMTCSPCYLARAADCHRGLACLEGIRPVDVFTACVQLQALGGAPLPGGVTDVP